MGTLNLDAIRNSGLTGYVMLQDVTHGGNQAAPELVSTGHGRIASLKDRLLNTENRQLISHHVLAAVHNALTVKYGRAEFASEVMAHVFNQTEVDQAASNDFQTIGHKHKRVTIEDIRAVLDYADSLNAVQNSVNTVKASLTYDSKGATYRIGDGKSKRIAEKQAIDTEIINAGKVIDKVDKFLEKDLSLGGNTSTNTDQKIESSIFLLQNTLRDVNGYIDMHHTSAPDEYPLPVLHQLKQDIQDRIAVLTSRAEDNAQVPDPVSEEAIKEDLKIWKSVGEKVIRSLEDTTGTAALSERQKDLNTLLEKWFVTRLKSGKNSANNSFNVKTVMKDFKDDFKAFLKTNIKNKGYHVPKDLGTTLKNHFNAELNQKPWDPINKTFTTVLENAKGEVKNCNVTSLITPAKHISGLGYTDVNGVMCHCTKEKKHSVNLARSQFFINDERPNAAPKEIFNGIRHAVLSAYGLEKGRERQDANKARAIETAKAAFLSRPDLIEKALANPNVPVTVRMTSVSLLTTADVGCKEGTMTKDQERAWADINGQPITVTVKRADNSEVEVTIQPDVTNFTLSSNPPKIIGIFGGVGFRWVNVEQSNKTAFAKFMTRVNEFLADNATSTDPEVQKKCKYVAVLRSQLRTIWEAKTYQEESGGAYKASARVAVMSYLMGDVPCWNCKSGKDRTGMMDAECKLLALLIEQGRDIPPPGSKMSKNDRQLYRDMVLKSGNLEMQKYNTGLGGYKALGDASTIKERLGNWLKRAKGASSYAKS